MMDLILTVLFWTVVMGGIVFVLAFRIWMDWRNR